MRQLLENFISGTERAMQHFNSIPTDIERLEEQINFQANLQAELDEKRPVFDRFVDLFSEFKDLIDIENVPELESIVTHLISR